MINRLISFSLKQPLLIFGLVILMAGVGWWSLTHIPIDAFPDVTNVQVQILAEAPGLSPVEVEQLVTCSAKSSKPSRTTTAWSAAILSSTLRSSTSFAASAARRR